MKLPQPPVPVPYVAIEVCNENKMDYTQIHIQILILLPSVIKRKGNTKRSGILLAIHLRTDKFHYWLNIELTLNLVLLESTLTICSAVITSHGLCFSFGLQTNQRRSPSNCDRQATLCSFVLSQIIASVLNEWFLRNQCVIPICWTSKLVLELKSGLHN